jgi:predicted HAD superfamily hydrolase
VLFVARDGYTLQKVYDIIKTDKTVNSHYVYASRMTNTIVNNLEHTINNLLLQKKRKELEIIMKYFSLTDGELSERYDKNLCSMEKIEDFFRENKLLIKNVADSAKNAYATYIASKVGDSNSFICVDSAPSKWSFQTLLCSLCQNTQILGAYVAIWSLPKKPFSFVSFIDYNKMNQISRELARFLFLLELLISAPEPPVISLTADGKPIYRDILKDELEKIKISHFINAGAIEFAKEVKMLFLVTNVTLDYNTILNLFKVYNCHYTLKDTRHRAYVKLDNDAYHLHYFPVFNDKLKVYLFGFIPFPKLSAKKIWELLDNLNKNLFTITISDYEIVVYYKGVQIAKICAC